MKLLLKLVSFCAGLGCAIFALFAGIPLVKTLTAAASPDKAGSAIFYAGVALFGVIGMFACFRFAFRRSQA